MARNESAAIDVVTPSTPSSWRDIQRSGGGTFAPATLGRAWPSGRRPCPGESIRVKSSASGRGHQVMLPPLSALCKPNPAPEHFNLWRLKSRVMRPGITTPRKHRASNRSREDRAIACGFRLHRPPKVMPRITAAHPPDLAPTSQVNSPGRTETERGVSSKGAVNLADVGSLTT